ncbi:hypothetical protein SLEP1_g60183 [Rubroshorea leprosula]|uniref:Uncharacterized protein n=1 Tax=Rubroshorea leprosula TaxID=152421 RepID=A0AAV5MUL0_9ROSI|nr:hypothetical protein SLEP1_g60183 [Rubroshorea leprosula]
MLAQIGRGHYDCAYDADSIASRIKRLFMKVSSIILADITIHMDGIELFPSHIPDLSFENPLIAFGTYKGGFPENIQVSGILADMTSFVTILKVQNAKDMLPLDKVFARPQIDALTTQAWFHGNKELEEKVATISLQTSYPSEFTSMVLLRTEGKEKAPESVLQQEILNKINKLLTKGDASSQEIIFFRSQGVGFGNLSATVKNKPPGSVELESLEGAESLVKPRGQQLLEESTRKGIMHVLENLDCHHCLPAGLACFECCECNNFDCFECCYDFCCCCCN